MRSRDRVSLAFIAAALAVAIFAVGGAPRWAQALCAALTLGALAVALPSRRAARGVAPLAITLAAAAGWTLLQLVPLPAGVLEALAPTLHGLREDGLAIAEVSSWSALSMDAPATLRAAAFFVILTGVAVAGLRIAASPAGRYSLAALVALGAGGAALVAAIHEITGAQKLYGIYTPRQVGPLLGPLINPNHLGCLTAIGATTGLALALYPKQTVARRVGWIVVLALCAWATLATYSRGATLALGVGALVVLATVALQRLRGDDGEQDLAAAGRHERFVATQLPIAILIACGLVLAVYLGASSVMQQLAATDLDELHGTRTKYAAWASALELVREAPWTGIGRGAFEPAFTRVHPASAYATFSHPENVAVQALVEWGILGTVLLAGGALWCAATALRRWRESPLAAGALGSLAAIVFQSNFDFGLELLGCAVPAVLLVATLTHGTLIPRSSPRRRKLLVVRGGQLAGLAAAGLLLLTGATRTVDETHAALGPSPAAPAVRAAIAAHPLDYLAFSLLAQDRLRSADPRAVRTLNHALRLHPTYPTLHVMTARMLLRGGRPTQAAASYATALRFSPAPRALLEEVARTLPIEVAAPAIPLELSPNTVLPVLGRTSPLVLRWLELRVALTPDLATVDALQTAALVQDQPRVAARAARVRCDLVPTDACRAELGRILVHVGAYAEAIDVVAGVREWRGPAEDRRKGWLVLCDAEAKLSDSSAALACLDALAGSGLLPPAHVDIATRRHRLLTAPPPPPLEAAPRVP